jgi:hypothetical protein
MAENGTKSIVFPAVNVAGEAKLKRLVETIADYMGVRVTIETVMVLQAKYPSDRPDIESIFKRLAGSKTGLTNYNLNQSKKSSPEEPAAGIETK